MVRTLASLPAYVATTSTDELMIHQYVTVRLRAVVAATVVELNKATVGGDLPARVITLDHRGRAVPVPAVRTGGPSRFPSVL